MTTTAIHRIIEQQAATRGDLVAVLDREQSRSYRELNHNANAVARHLMAAGFRRGARALVCLPRGADLATVLLAVLKAGGAYTWIDPERSGEDTPRGVSFLVDERGGQSRYLHLDLSQALAQRVACSPNLPILTRGTDIACVLPDGEGAAAPVMIPHATIAALRSRAVTHPTPWTGDAAAFDLWMALMAGTTAVVEIESADVAAA